MRRLVDLVTQPLALASVGIPQLLEQIRSEQSAVYSDTSPPAPQTRYITAAGNEIPPDEMAKAAVGTVVAVVPLTGIVTRHGYRAAAGTLAIQRTLTAMDSDPAIHSILIDVDSPGGSVYGTNELADTVRQIRDRGQTQIKAAVDPLMASAATWIATAASRVVAIPSADVGSIGVISVYTDYSEMLSERGIKYEIERVPELKARFTSVEPMTDAMRETMQQRNSEVYADFLVAMAKNRGVTTSEVEQRFGGGEVMSASLGVASGLIDAVGSLDDLIQESVAAIEEGKKREREAGKRRRAMEAEVIR